ncbi:MAG: aminomethyl-transferring glycine dehydrogenase subunit GcvPA [Coriobacteriia bacterium]|nr:aminomethyl-transferring glycine dehydrogenase subunit GcvPA [Coriobacteriia bacterium]MCL2870682.1 aminomethyl-transferring glycine dehydrogenase subunit GcvPA [Coriobacteriia bacterium]
MNYISITQNQRKLMLQRVDAASTDELYEVVPESVRLDSVPKVTGGMSEIDLSRQLAELANINVAAHEYTSFAGAGCYDHYSPAFIDHLLRRPEFFTAYTPYQPEVSQGTLQAIYEYQTGICELTGMDVANASMYDGATALVEAAFMALRLTRGKRKVMLVSEALHPEKLETMMTYASSELIDPVFVPVNDELITDSQAFLSLLEEYAGEVAAVLLPYPNFFGIIEDVSPLIIAAKEAGAYVVLDTNPIMLGLLKRPAELGADIVVGEGQPLGSAMSFGGPGLGYFACTQKCVRQLPGRLVGRTTDVDGNRGYVLTMSTREQHIRREKATSNICSNHALNALIAGMYLAAVGSKGLKDIATDCVTKAHYLRNELLTTGLFVSPKSDNVQSFGYEFPLVYTGSLPITLWHDELFERGYLAGVILAEGSLSNEDEGHLDDTADNSAETSLVLFATTEKRTRAEIDEFVQVVKDLG